MSTSSHSSDSICSAPLRICASHCCFGTTNPSGPTSLKSSVSSSERASRSASLWASAKRSRSLLISWVVMLTVCWSLVIIGLLLDWWWWTSAFARSGAAWRRWSVRASRGPPPQRRERDEKQRQQCRVISDVDRVAALDREVQAGDDAEDREADRRARDSASTERVTR